MTLGVQPTRPATEYGYLIPDLEQRQQLHLDAFRLKAFQEKPTREHAELLLKQPGVAWNAGMFMWRRRAIRSALEAFAPAVFEQVALAFGAGTLDEAYATVESISIDYAVMEPAAAAGKVVMGSMDVGWNDLGSWTSLLGELGLPGIEASIAKPDEPLESADDDLLIWRPEPRRLTSTPGANARMVGSNRPVAVLRGAGPHRSQIDALLERCSSPEAQA